MYSSMYCRGIANKLYLIRTDIINLRELFIYDFKEDFVQLKIAKDFFSTKSNWTNSILLYV